MSRYNRTRYNSTPPSTSNERTSTTNPKIDKPWWQSPIILLAILLGIGALGATLFIEFTTQHIIHIRADDSSDSAKGYASQRLQHCQASSQHYKPGDTAIAIPFADRPVITQNISIFNSLSLLGQCKETSRPIANKQPGTSLILLLERLQNIVQKEHARNNFNPVVVTVTLQDDEPGPNQPDSKDLERVKALVHSITQDRGVIAFMVEDEKLRSQLDTELASEGDVQVCSFKDVSSCVDWAFNKGRQLRTR